MCWFTPKCVCGSSSNPLISRLGFSSQSSDSPDDEVEDSDEELGDGEVEAPEDEEVEALLASDAALSDVFSLAALSFAFSAPVVSPPRFSPSLEPPEA